MPNRRPLRIGIVCYPTIGGSGIVATELGLQLYCNGHDVHFISYDLPERLLRSEDGGFAVDCGCKGAGSIRFHHIDVPNYPLFRFPPYTLALATCLYRIVLEEDLDLVHVHYAIPHSTSALLAKSMLRANAGRSIRIITTLHGTDSVLVGREPNYRAAVEFSINGSDAVTSVSEWLRRQTLETFAIRREIRVIPNMVDIQQFSPAQPLEDGPPPDRREPVIMHISNFRRVKRVTDVITAFDLVSRAQPCRLVMVGEGPDRAEAENLAAQLGIANRVEFVGATLDVPSQLRRADLVLSCSETESFGLSIAEAMACGVPVVAYRVGGIPEVVEDGVTGVLVPPSEVALLAEAAVKLLRCRNLRWRMAVAARKRVVSRFSSDVVLPMYEHMYRELVALGPDGQESDWLNHSEHPQSRAVVAGAKPEKTQVSVPQQDTSRG